MIASLAATVEISVDAAGEAILSGLDGIFKLKENGSAEGFTVDMFWS